MNRYFKLPLAAAAAITVALATVALGASRAELDAGVADTLTRFYAQDESHRDLAHKATAVLVFPHVTKAGAGVGGEYGEGALQVKGKTVGYYRVAGGSVGATLGVARHSEVVLFMTEEARDHFMSSRDWSIGADAGVAVVSKGTAGKYDSGTLNKPVLAFVFGEKGLIADVSLAGAKISKVSEHAD
jgi:lipid-binding SYLF domain-containing protein